MIMYSFVEVTKQIICVAQIAKHSALSSFVIELTDQWKIFAEHDNIKKKREKLYSDTVANNFESQKCLTKSTNSCNSL